MSTKQNCTWQNIVNALTELLTHVLIIDTIVAYVAYCVHCQWNLGIKSFVFCGVLFCKYFLQSFEGYEHCMQISM